MSFCLLKCTGLNLVTGGMVFLAIFYVSFNCFVCSEFCGDIDSLELGDMVEYSLSKGKGNKVSAEKVNKTHAGKAFKFLSKLKVVL